MKNFGKFLQKKYDQAKTNQAQKKENANDNAGTKAPSKEAEPIPAEPEIVVDHDISVCFDSESGKVAAQTIERELSKKTLSVEHRKVKVHLVPCDAKSDLQKTESELSRSVQRGHIVAYVISQNSTKNQALTRAIEHAMLANLRIIVVHFNASCAFPDASEFPESLVDVFNQKAITFIEQYADSCADMILKKIEAKNTSVEDLITRAFFSHKRSTGQGMTGRLYERLKGDYKLFLDSEADFDLTQLTTIVQNTHLFVFIMTPGILESYWCLQELRAAIAVNKPILIIKDFQFQLPPPENLPEYIADLKDILYDKNITIPYMAEFYEQCITQLRQWLGPPDAVIESFYDTRNKLAMHKTILAKEFEVPGASEVELKLFLDISSDLNMEGILSALEGYFKFPIENITKIYMPDNYITVSDEACKILSKKAKKLKSVDIADEITDQGLKYLGKCNSLEQIKFDTISKITDIGFKNFFQDKKTSNLRVLKFEMCDGITDETFELVANHVPLLEEFDLDGCVQVTSEALSHIAKLPHLTSAVLKSNDNIDADGIQYLANGACKLTKLEVSSCDAVTDEAFAGFTALTRVKLSGLKQITNDIADLLKPNPIQFFSIDRCAKVNAAFLMQLDFPQLEELSMGTLVEDTVAFMFLVSWNSSIKKLSFTSGAKLNDDSMKGFAGLEFPKLESLFIGSGMITDDGMDALWKANFPILKNLSLYEATKVTAKGFENFKNANFVGSLESLTMNLKGTDDALIANIFNAPAKSLRKFDLGGSSDKVTPAAIKTIFNAPHIRLQKIKIPNDQFNTEAMRNIVEGKNASELTKLNFSGSEGVNDAVIKVLAENSHKVPNLTHLDLGVTQVGDDGLLALSKGKFWKLKKLDLSCLEKPTEDGWKKFMEAPFLYKLEKFSLDCSNDVKPEHHRAFTGIPHAQLMEILARRQKVYLENRTNEDPNEDSEGKELAEQHFETMKDLVKIVSDLADDEIDICLLYSTVDAEGVIKALKGDLTSKVVNSRNVTVSTLGCSPKDTPADYAALESNVTKARVLAVILSKESLAIPSMVHYVEVAITNNVHVVLVHHQASCPFPGPAEQPPSLVQGGIFNDKAITFMEQFSDTCAEQLSRKLNKRNTKTQDIVTRAFLSHKRSSAQGMAGRLYEGLKGYKVFLDSEASFDLHDLALIVKHTGLFIFILSEGILDSFWCMQELRSAVENKKKVLLVRDVKYRLPNPLPEHVKDMAHILLESPCVDYVAEFHQQCVERIKKELGPRDEVLDAFSDPSAKEVNKIITNAASLKEIELDMQFSGINLQDVIEALQYQNFPFQKVTKFAFRCSGKIKGSSVRFLVENCPKLRYLYLRNSPITDSIAEAMVKNCPSLEFLQFSSNKLTDEGLATLFQLKKLQDVRISLGESVTEEGFKHIKGSQIKVLKIKADGIKDETIQKIVAGCPNLENFTITVNENITAVAVQALAKLTKLKIINVSYNEKLKSVDTLKAISQAAFAPTLERLKIESLELTAPMAEPLTTGKDFPKLKFLQVNDNNWGDVTMPKILKKFGATLVRLALTTKTKDETAKAVAANCPNLKILNASSELWTDVGVTALANGVCTKLEALDISYVKMTDASVQALFHGNLKNLVAINLESCEKLTNEAAKAISTGNSQKLQVLKLDSCQKLTDECCKWLGSGNLVELAALHFDFYGVTGITDAGIEFLLSDHNRAAKFKELVFNTCLKLTDKGLKLISQRCFGLESLSVSGCLPVSDVGVRFIAEMLGDHLKGICLSETKVTKIGLGYFNTAIMGRSYVNVTHSYFKKFE